MSLTTKDFFDRWKMGSIHYVGNRHGSTRYNSNLVLNNGMNKHANIIDMSK